MQTGRVQCNVINVLNDCNGKILSGQWESLRPPIDGQPKKNKKINNKTRQDQPAYRT